MGIHLKMLFVACPYTGNADKQKGRHFGIYQVSVMVYEPCLNSVMDVHKHAVPMVERLWIDGILEKFQQQ